MQPVDPTALGAQQPAQAGAGRAQPGGSFGKLVAKAVEDANRTQLAAEGEARALAEGKGDVVDAMVALSRADLALRFVVSLRNRALEAYNEIMRLQV